MAQPEQSSTSSRVLTAEPSSSLVHEGADPDHVREQRNHHQFRESEIEQHHIDFPSHREIFFGFDEAWLVRDDMCSCAIVVLTFWFFVSLTLILGSYGSTRLTLGPKCSVLIQPNPLFVQSITVEQLYDNNSGLILYGFYKSPPLDVVETWSEKRNFSVPSDSHKEWIYYFNEGSQINISYNVNSPASSVFLVIAQGNDGLAQWLQDPTYPNTTISWNVIQGIGVVQQHIFKSATYYVAVGNMNSEEVVVELTLTVRSLTYNTTEAYYKCTFTDGVCSLSILFPNSNAVVLNTRGPEEGSDSDEWNVKVSYGPRWATYVVGIWNAFWLLVFLPVGGLTVLMLAAFNFLDKLQCYREGSRVHYSEVEPARAPLLSPKDDDLSSWGSSYDSVSDDEEGLEDFLAAASLEGKLRDGEDGNNTRRLCAICFDAPRDCFFLPCGHCVACFACGTRVAEAEGTCPICRRNMKKVRKIFTV